MMQRLIYLVCLLVLSAELMGQSLLEDQFIDGDLSINPEWLGDIANYTSLDGILQLSAPEAGTSSIFAAYDRVDSVSIAVTFDINTNPSAGNFSRIYLFVDNLDLSTANGYYLQLGESGSEDAIELVRLESGQPSTVARGDMSGIASRPEKSLAIDITNDGTFALTSTDIASNVVSEEILTVIDWSALPTAGFFGFYNTYTSSNVANYSYRGLGVERFTPDLDPPVLLSAEAIDATTVRLLFDEEVDDQNLSPTLVTFDPSATVRSVATDQSSITIDLENPLQSSVSYLVTITGVSDLLGNVASAQSTTLDFAETPTVGDLTINEILFNPEGNGSDFVEILNLSDKRLTVRGLTISNASNGNSEVVDTDFELEPRGLVLITEDMMETAASYPTNDQSVFIENDLPSFNNSDGNVTITTTDGQTLDSVDYDESWHFALLDDVDGVSLERIDPNGPSQTASNWQSAASSVNFGTPGLPNSAFVGLLPSGDELLQVVDDTFSPDLDGEDDQIAIQYNLPASGYLANANVYDQRGHLLRNLYNQELLGISGLLTWDGLDDNNRRLPIGPYIISVELFNLDGDRINWRAPVVIATQLD